MFWDRAFALEIDGHWPAASLRPSATVDDEYVRLETESLRFIFRHVRHCRGLGWVGLLGRDPCPQFAKLTLEAAGENWEATPSLWVQVGIVHVK